MSANNSQGIYTQLPQSLSDSDSETEINDLKEIKHTSSRKLHQNGHSNGFTLPKHVVKRTKGFAAMSRSRKIAFLLSIALCFLVIIVFLCVLPCSSHGTCPTKIGSWKIEHEGIEFRGRINVINGRYKSSVNLALLARKSLNNGDTHSGAIALQTGNGAMSWFVPQVRAPSEMVCDLMDMNEDGIDDCLLLSEMGLQAIEPLRGDIIWHGHNTKMIIKNMDFPTLLPDLNKDNVNELISVTDLNNGQHNKVILICGRTGQLLASIVLLMCDDIDDFKYDDKLVIYNCKNASHNNYYKISIGDLQRKIYNSTNPVQATKIQYQPGQLVEYILHGRKLVVENKGSCPDCTTNVELLDVRHDTPIRLFGWTKPKTYVMKPISYSFSSDRNNAMHLKGHLNGFIMKLWQWPDVNAKFNGTVQRNNVSEKVLLISFNDTDYQVINVSYVQITQLCFPNGLDCQPALSNRNDSLLLTDLDMDGSQELINYSTTYKCGDGDDDTCYLISKMEVVQLETEMAKLYAK